MVVTHTHMQRPKVRKVEWKQTDGQTDGGDCITSSAIAFGDKDHQKGYSLYVVQILVQQIQDDGGRPAYQKRKIAIYLQPFDRFG